MPVLVNYGSPQQISKQYKTKEQMTDAERAKLFFFGGVFEVDRNDGGCGSINVTYEEVKPILTRFFRAIFQ